MSNSLLTLLLIVLTAGCALNLFLTLRLASRIGSGVWPPPRQDTLPSGTPLPNFVARRLVGNATFASDALAGAPAVLVFLAAGCPKCREVKPRLVALLPAMNDKGVRLLLVSMDATVGKTDALAQEPLREFVLVLRAKQRALLNPGRLTPYYIFVDDQGMVVASGLVGEPDWVSFLEQMEEGDICPPASRAESASD